MSAHGGTESERRSEIGAAVVAALAEIDAAAARRGSRIAQRESDARAAADTAMGTVNRLVRDADELDVKQLGWALRLYAIGTVRVGVSNLKARDRRALELDKDRLGLHVRQLIGPFVS